MLKNENCKRVLTLETYKHDDNNFKKWFFQQNF